MSSRRKDMWKLLYNLVNRSGADLNEVFAFVDDILCNEPSLIRASLRELNNRFQDTFILWLVNKFVKSLSEPNREDVHLKNIKLQQKIVSSCLVNRPLLFERLVSAYILAIEQLAVEQPDVLTEEVESVGVEVTAFTCADLCLREIDETFSFHSIHVPYDRIDERVQSLLLVLRHALSIGYEVYPQLFINSLDSVFMALRECDFPSKMQCLRYCHALFQAAHDLCPELEYYHELTVHALLLLWDQLPMWLQASCAQSKDVRVLTDITKSLFAVLEGFSDQLHCKREMLELAFDMLRNILELKRHNFETVLTEELVDCLVGFMLVLQEDDKAPTLSTDKENFLMQRAAAQPELVRLLAVTALPDLEGRRPIFDYLDEKIIALLGGETVELQELQYLKELLRALIYVEFKDIQRKQILHLSVVQQDVDDVDDEEDEIRYPEEYEFNYKVFKNPQELKAKIKQFLNRTEKIEDVAIVTKLLQIAVMFVLSSSMEKSLDSELRKQIISYVERPLKRALLARVIQNAEERDLVHLSLEMLIKLSINEEMARYSEELFEKLNQTIFSKDMKNSKMLQELALVYLGGIKDLAISCIHISSRIFEFINDVSPSVELLVSLLKVRFCVLAANVYYGFISYPYTRKKESDFSVEVVCRKCERGFDKSVVIDYMKKHSSIIVESADGVNTIPMYEIGEGPSAELIADLIFKDKQFAFIVNHLVACNFTITECLHTLEATAGIASLPSYILPRCISKYAAENELLLMRLAKFMLAKTLETLQYNSALNAEKQKQQQLCLIEMISYCGTAHFREKWFFCFFKMTFFFLVHPDSLVVQEAVLCASEMCAKLQVQPARLWNWYKRDALSLIVKLAIYVYLRKGVRLTRSLKAFTKMLGFSCVQEFICKYYRLLTTMILPYCVKQPQCKGLLVSISKVTRKPIPTLFTASFLRIYTHIYLTEEAEVGNKCIELILKCTAFSLRKLMNSDVKQTVSELLIYFNRNPKFVMKAFQCLLLNEQSGSPSTSKVVAKTPSNDFAKFIADRFLGVITYFETCLAEPSFEKSLKKEALHSLGQIIRFVGAEHVTQFRFKIIAMLSFVLLLDDNDICYDTCDDNDELQTICLKVWNIFLHIVNIEELGPSLSRIVASLQPLLGRFQKEINAIYEFIILKNESLLGAHIPDLYFLVDENNVDAPIRECVSRQTELFRSDKLSSLGKLDFFYKQVTNEHLQVRIYGLDHLRKFINTHRLSINRMVLSEVRIDPLIDNIIHVLVEGCRHEERNLQLASAKCLGELGAIDPSYLPFHSSLLQKRELPLSIHTDDFAIMALTELCRAYQFQKDTKFVDNFSLAIQETLSVCGVSPKENKKLNVWQAMPPRMQQVMEPLLSSCYTGSRRESKCKEHPIFNSSSCHSYSEWAFAWASRLIDYVHSEETKHLLNSYKPSIKRDSNTLATFFPYILLHALQDCNEQQMQQIFEEFEAVFSFSSRGVEAQPAYETTGGCKEFLSTKYAVDRSGSGADAERKANVPLSSEQYEALEHITRNCSKLCSEQIDFLKRWLREWQRYNLVAGKLGETNTSYNKVSSFLECFDMYLIARANYNAGEFARALMYLEEYIENDAETRLQEQISFLIEIYGNLIDADSVEGAVYKKKSNLSLHEEILVNNIVDRPQETMACYEQLMSSRAPINQDHIKGMIDCYLRMDTAETALLITDGLWQKLTEQYTDDYFKECKSELLWRLGRYDELKELLEDSVVRRKTANWNIQCAETFMLFRKDENESDFYRELDVIRGNVLTTMRNCSSVAKHHSYPHTYDDVVKLHLLNEVEKTKDLFSGLREMLLDTEEADGCVQKVRAFITSWDERLCVLQPVVRVLEPLLCFRRNLLEETKRLLEEHFDRKHLGESSVSPPELRSVVSLLDDEIGRLWLRSVQMHRAAGSLQQAQLSIMKAASYAPKALFIEKAQLMWEKGDQTNSFKLLSEQLELIESKCERNIRTLDAGDRALYGEAKYLQATYSAESMNICAELNLRYFREAISGNRNSEKCHVQLAQYMEKMYGSFSPEQQHGDNGRTMLLEIMVNYAKSLKYGHENVYQSLPRLLSLWLDYTSDYAALAEKVSNPSAAGSSSDTAKLPGMQELARKMNDLINNCAQILPTSIFYTAFSQLLSRICHPSSEVFNVLRTIIIKLIENFPHQSLWMLLPIFKSAQTNRIKRCKQIFTDPRLAKSKFFQKLLGDFNMLAERLIELTNKDVATDRVYGLSTLVKQLPKLFEDSTFSQILLPFEKYMQASFPITTSSSSQLLQMNCSSSGSQEHVSIPKNPFPYQQIFIIGIKEEISVLRSAAKPKKITIQCNDGRKYDVMLKPKDDMRKDFRLMEFNGLVKRYLHQDSQARHRRLRIRTYAAIPFNEECGLVEWIPKLTSFRAICNSFYRMRGLGLSDRLLRQCALPRTETAEKKRSIFVDSLLPQHPPVFQEWFRQRFPTPHSWYEARSAYVKTIAVMSMVGYILGLGDRHGENVLFDETNGDAVHVDFNCLCNQGECFAYPELVPFRLTHNMVFAMGPLGVEGMFRKCCEITLRVLKQEKKTLMSVLLPFVYDLVVSNRNYSKNPARAELTDPKAMSDVRRIEERLQGYVKRTMANSMPLSTEGQVNFLISEATNIDNLAAMYIGWGAFM